MRLSYFLMFIVFAVYLSAFSAMARAASVQGQLVFANNSPATYVAVRLNAPGKGASEFAYTGRDGKYYMRNVPAGQYQLEIWRGGKMVLSIPVAVQEPAANLATARLP